MKVKLTKNGVPVGNKKQYITLLSVLSAISVVVLHMNCFWNFSYDSYWKWANVIESVFYFAVPVFFMISGATLINYRERYSTKEFFKKRIQKTVIPFVVWSVIGVVWWVFFYQNDASQLTPRFIVDGILNTSFVAIYWFFIPLFCVYLSIPLFSAIEKTKRKEVFSYIAIISFLLNILIPFIISVFHINLEWPMTISVGSGYLFFVIVGYLLSEYDLKKYSRIIIYLLGVAGLIIHIVGTYIISKNDGTILRLYKGYTNLPSVLYSIAVFVFFKHTGNKIMSFKFSKIIAWLEKYTFGIYLVHYFVRDVITQFCNQMSISMLTLPYVIVSSVLAIIISVLIIYLLRKIPIVRKIVP